MSATLRFLHLLHYGLSLLVNLVPRVTHLPALLEREDDTLETRLFVSAF